MDKFEGQEMNKIRPNIREWFDQLINENVMGKKPEIIRDKLKDTITRDNSTLFETKKEERKKKKYNNRINKDRIIRDMKTLFETEEEKKERKELQKKKEYNETLIKDGII